MVRSRTQSRCGLSAFERRLYCSKTKVGRDCLRPWFLGHLCQYLEMSKLDVMKVAKKGVREIVAKGGFTREAIKYAERYRPTLRLKHGGTTVKPSRRKIIARAA